MSLILEALRKSEAERQRGRAPGLFVEQVALRPAARSRTPAWAWALGLLVVALLGVLGWREWSRQAAPADPAPTARVADSAAQDIARPPEPVAPGPDPAATPGPSTSRDAAYAPTAPTRAPRPAPAPAASAPSASAPAPGPAAPAAARPTAVAPPAAPPAPADIPEESLPTLGSLDAGTRARLPPLRLSMHVFATEPAQRFVILDGRRLVEGANPSPGVVLEEIRRDGLVLSVNGQRLLLARP